MTDLIDADRGWAQRRGPQVGDRIDALLLEREQSSGAFFSQHAERIARLCHRTAERFARDGRLVAFGDGPAARSDARHVAVEFVHPVIVGKRALPALGLASEGGPLATQVALEVEADDSAIAFAGSWRAARRGRCTTAAQSSFLYPFLGEQEHDLEAIVADVRESVLMKADETCVLRAQTLTEGRGALLAAAAALRDRLDAGGRPLALGNGGSATDAMDVVADFRVPCAGGPARRALDLTEDTSIITAIANDIGIYAIFSRQVIAHGRPGDALLALSTSGNSLSVLAGLHEARKRGMLTLAMVGYDGGAVARDRLADDVIVARSEHIPRVQEAHASAYHALRELVELADPPMHEAA